eukprot:TRINITY_DN4881_c0_g2_i1.p1 TRINITY_DN4881_c0_g2~~TRINITY_DN4881_c0_g2_i1.p1  ORF type:complete len:1006 (+),score=167.49 TRINITY_DN4881_c0_g2_i1:362-3019(+)
MEVSWTEHSGHAGTDSAAVVTEEGPGPPQRSPSPVVTAQPPPAAPEADLAASQQAVLALSTASAPEAVRALAQEQDLDSGVDVSSSSGISAAPANGRSSPAPLGGNPLAPRSASPPPGADAAAAAPSAPDGGSHADPDDDCEESWQQGDESPPPSSADVAFPPPVPPPAMRTAAAGAAKKGIPMPLSAAAMIPAVQDSESPLMRSSPSIGLGPPMQTPLGGMPGLRWRRESEATTVLSDSGAPGRMRPLVSFHQLRQSADAKRPSLTRPFEPRGLGAVPAQGSGSRLAPSRRPADPKRAQKALRMAATQAAMIKQLQQRRTGTSRPSLPRPRPSTTSAPPQQILSAMAPPSSTPSPVAEPPSPPEFVEQPAPPRPAPLFPEGEAGSSEAAADAQAPEQGAAPPPAPPPVQQPAQQPVPAHVGGSAAVRRRSPPPMAYARSRSPQASPSAMPLDPELDTYVDEEACRVVVGALCVVAVAKEMLTGKPEPWAWFGGKRVSLVSDADADATPPGTPPGSPPASASDHTDPIPADDDGAELDDFQLDVGDDVDDDALSAEERLRRALARERRLRASIAVGGAAATATATAAEPSRRERARPPPVAVPGDSRPAAATPGSSVPADAPLLPSALRALTPASQARRSVSEPSSVTPRAEKALPGGRAPSVTSSRAVKKKKRPTVTLSVPIGVDLMDDGAMDLEMWSKSGGQTTELQMPLVTQEGDWLLGYTPVGTLTPADFYQLQIDEYCSARNTCIVLGVPAYIVFSCCRLRSVPATAGAQKGLALHLCTLGLVCFAVMIVFFLENDTHPRNFFVLGAAIVLEFLAAASWSRGRQKKRRFEGKEPERLARARHQRKLRGRRAVPSVAQSNSASPSPVPGEAGFDNLESPGA